MPNLQERQYVLTYIDYLYHNYKKKKKCKNAYPDIWSLSSLSEKERFIQAVVSSCNPYMQHLRGNVSEWLDEPHITAGGSWCDKLEDILASDTSYCEMPNAWTGFRNVCQWKKW